MTKRILLLTGWLLIPVIALAYHMGPGQDRKALDEVAKHIRLAEEDAATENFSSAVREYEDALKAMPEGRTAETRKIRLEKAKAQMLANKLPEAHSDLKTLVDELSADASVETKLLDDARAALANSQHYTTWLMRLEGLGRDDWEPEIEAARQTFKLLAESADARGDSSAATKYKEDLEAAVRLARIDLSELQGLNLPKQCKGCYSCKGNKIGKGKVPPKSNDIRSAGGSPPIDDSGH
jgi:hypothetical protein